MNPELTFLIYSFREHCYSFRHTVLGLQDFLAWCSIAEKVTI